MTGLADSNPSKRLIEALESISRLVSWCRHGEADRGETLDLIDEVVNKALREAPPEKP